MDYIGQPFVPWGNTSSSGVLMVLLPVIFAAVDLQFLSHIPLTAKGRQLLDLLFSDHCDITRVDALLNEKQRDEDAPYALLAKVEECFKVFSFHGPVKGGFAGNPPVACVSVHDSSPLEPVVHVGDSVYKLVSALSCYKGRYHQTFQHHCCWYLHDAKRQAIPKSAIPKSVMFPENPKDLIAQVFVRVGRFVPSTFNLPLLRFDLEKTLSRSLYLDVHFVNTALTKLVRNGWKVQRAGQLLQQGAVAAQVDQAHIFLVGRLESIVFVYDTHVTHSSYAAVLNPLLTSEVAKVYFIRAHQQPGTNTCGLTTVNSADQTMEFSPLDTNWEIILDTLEGLQPCVPDLKRLLLSALLLPGPGTYSYALLPPPLANRSGPKKKIYSYAFQRTQKKTHELHVLPKSGIQLCVVGQVMIQLCVVGVSVVVPPRAAPLYHSAVHESPPSTVGPAASQSSVQAAKRQLL
jgi:hypothetical protein